MEKAWVRIHGDAGKGYANCPDCQTRAKRDDFKARVALKSAFFATNRYAGLTIAKFNKMLWELVNGQKVNDKAGNLEVSITKEEVAAQGYWPVTRAVVEQFVKDVYGVSKLSDLTTAVASGKNVLLSGFSQGGGRVRFSARLLSGPIVDPR